MPDNSTPLQAGEPAAASTSTPSVELFEDAAHAPSCSFNECLAGHKWPPVIAAAKCPGCDAPYVAVQRTNCPYCNEPTVRTVLRSDFVPRGSGAVARCKGTTLNGESLDVDMVRQQWREVEAAPAVETFEDRRAAERATPAG